MKLDLIDRQELYNQIRLYLFQSHLGEITSQETLTISEIATIINNMPNVNARPVKSLKWEINEIEEDENRKYEYKCPNCGVRYVSSRLYYKNYCDKCGAHMLNLKGE